MERGTVLVTGGNSGIGLECARVLARQGRGVLIASRDRAASAAAVKRITTETGNPNVSEMGLDLGSFYSIRRFARRIEADDVPLQALVCNAGVQFSGGLRLSSDGFELTFAVNHLGHFLLTQLLIDRLAANAPSRIVVVASGVHDPARWSGMPKPAIADFETLAACGGARAGAYNGQLAYVNSKVCNMWFCYELARRIEEERVARNAERITVNAFDPGLVPGSGLARDYSPAQRWIWDRVLPRVARLLTGAVPSISTAAKSGDALARLVLDPTLAQVSGKYFPSHRRWQEAPSSKESYDLARARELWDESLRMCGIAARG